MVMGGQRHALAALPPGKRNVTHCAGGWVGIGVFWAGAKNLAPTWIRSLDCKYARCKDNSRQSHIHYFSMLHGFNATCFGSYTRSHHQADKAPNKNYYVNRIVLFHIIHTYIYIVCPQSLFGVLKNCGAQTN
jgi:hypothetical protein